MAEPAILVVNPGSTTTRISLFAGDTERVSECISHGADELAGFARIMDQAPMRRAAIDRFIAANRVDTRTLAGVVGRGGLLRPLESGVYAVDDEMLCDLRSASYGEHASNLGALLARLVADTAGCPAFIVDPVVVDEMEPIARISGIPGIERRSIFHALNQKSAAREAASRIGRRYEESSIIVAHMGGGCSVGVHRFGRVVDVNNALDGEGPFSPERAGTVPAGQLVDLAFSGESRTSIKRRLTGGGGLVAHCGTNDLAEIGRRICSGDTHASILFHAMAYQIAKQIASYGATLCGEVDLIVLTGGMAHDEHLVAEIVRRVSYLAPVEVIQGEREMLSLARGALAAIAGRTPVKRYGGAPVKRAGASR